MIYRKKGLSAVVTTVIMIALVVAAVAIVWVAVNSLIKDSLDNVKTCNEVSQKIEINDLYTCYDSTNNFLQFSISIKDIDIDELLISISSNSKTESYKLSNTLQSVTGLKDYYGNDSVQLPGKNSGLTYRATGFTNKPDRIEIAPLIEEKQCQVSDSASDIDDCQALI